MTRDWIWGWVALLPAMVLAFMVLAVTGLLETAPELVGFGLLFALTISPVTAVLWIMNRRSIRRAIKAGREIELVIRPIEALPKAAMLFAAIFGAMTLLRLMLYGEIHDWGQSIVFSGALAYPRALTSTAYRKAG